MTSQWYVPCLRGVCGDWVYYSALVKAHEVSQRITPSHEIREARELEDFLQRTLKPRVDKIAKYLSTRDSRFFNSIIVGIFGGVPRWAEFDPHVARQKLAIDDPVELKESLGLLVFAGNEKMFAIDGQHRVEGIKRTYKKNPDRIHDDQFSVIFVAHLDTPAGKVRTRRLFCDINKNAVAVSEGDKAMTKRHAKGKGPLAKIRQAFADYIRSEGCDCCRNSEAHDEAKERLAKLLGVSKYKDGSGYNFGPWESERGGK